MIDCPITQEEVMYLYGHIAAIYVIVMNVIVIIHLARKAKRRKDAMVVINIRRKHDKNRTTSN